MVFLVQRWTIYERVVRVNGSSRNKTSNLDRKELRLRLRDDHLIDALRSEARSRGCNPSDVAKDLVEAHYGQDPFMRAADDAARQLGAKDEREAFSLFIALFNRARADGYALELVRELQHHDNHRRKNGTRTTHEP